MADESSDSTEETRILRRAPLSTGSQPVLSGPETSSEPPTGLLRRHPTGELPVASVSAPVTQYVPRAKPVAVGTPRVPRADSRAAQATAVAAIVSGWASGVIATDLIAGWWATDPLFCVAIGFLAAVSAAGSISGVIALLLRRPNARLLIVVGAVIAILIFASLFVAGAKLPALVYAMPLLPLASIVLAALPATARWSRPG
ncbi:hypothetical protein C6A87_022615 [Mycobacterium sp. ITM-2016-00317]|uniref:hypothetical protein n=1 Tax=Mycobacterium sp. ITM-2016-00317 TaxID=2099694 RepID=UPI000D4AD3BE|nr:hypothetical protein [Mycobacterium sp. ITM-2016-00317]WNG86592.1 hypothetical protein C6A87_022615 [Mycobacterium sp. ITM-2016-00317]